MFGTTNTPYETKNNFGNKVEMGNWFNKKKDQVVINNFTLLMKNKLGGKVGTTALFDPRQEVTPNNNLNKQEGNSISLKQEPSPIRTEKIVRNTRTADGVRVAESSEKENNQNLSNRDPKVMEAYITQVSRQTLAFVPGTNNNDKYSNGQTTVINNSRWSDLETQALGSLIPDILGGKTPTSLLTNPYFMTKLLKAHEPATPKDYFNNLFREHFLQTYHSLRFIQAQKTNYDRLLAEKKVEIKTKPFNKGRKIFLTKKLTYLSMHQI
jgi:hypothetical protein